MYMSCTISQSFNVYRRHCNRRYFLNGVRASRWKSSTFDQIWFCGIFFFLPFVNHGRTYNFSLLVSDIRHTLFVFKCIGFSDVTVVTRFGKCLVKYFFLKKIVIFFLPDRKNDFVSHAVVYLNCLYIAPSLHLRVRYTMNTFHTLCTDVVSMRQRIIVYSKTKSFWSQFLDRSQVKRNNRVLSRWILI